MAMIQVGVSSVVRRTYPELGGWVELVSSPSVFDLDAKFRNILRCCRRGSFMGVQASGTDRGGRAGLVGEVEFGGGFEGCSDSGAVARTCLWYDYNGDKRLELR